MFFDAFENKELYAHDNSLLELAPQTPRAALSNDFFNQEIKGRVRKIVFDLVTFIPHAYDKDAAQLHEILNGTIEEKAEHKIDAIEKRKREFIQTYFPRQAERYQLEMILINLLNQGGAVTLSDQSASDEIRAKTWILLPLFFNSPASSTSGILKHFNDFLNRKEERQEATAFKCLGSEVVYVGNSTDQECLRICENGGSVLKQSLREVLNRLQVAVERPHIQGSLMHSEFCDHSFIQDAITLKLKSELKSSPKKAEEVINDAKRACEINNIIFHSVLAGAATPNTVNALAFYYLTTWGEVGVDVLSASSSKKTKIDFSKVIEEKLSAKKETIRLKAASCNFPENDPRHKAVELILQALMSLQSPRKDSQVAPGDEPLSVDNSPVRPSRSRGTAKRSSTLAHIDFADSESPDLSLENVQASSFSLATTPLMSVKAGYTLEEAAHFLCERFSLALSKGEFNFDRSPNESNNLSLKDQCSSSSEGVVEPVWLKEFKSWIFGSLVGVKRIPFYRVCRVLREIAVESSEEYFDRAILTVIQKAAEAFEFKQIEWEQELVFLSSKGISLHLQDEETLDEAICRLVENEQCSAIKVRKLISSNKEEDVEKKQIWEDIEYQLNQGQFVAKNLELTEIVALNNWITGEISGTELPIKLNIIGKDSLKAEFLISLSTQSFEHILRVMALHQRFSLVDPRVAYFCEQIEKARFFESASKLSSDFLKEKNPAWDLEDQYLLKSWNWLPWVASCAQQFRWTTSEILQFLPECSKTLIKEDFNFKQCQLAELILTELGIDPKSVDLPWNLLTLVNWAGGLVSSTCTANRIFDVVSTKLDFTADRHSVLLIRMLWKTIKERLAEAVADYPSTMDDLVTECQNHPHFRAINFILQDLESDLAIVSLIRGLAKELHEKLLTTGPEIVKARSSVILGMGQRQVAVFRCKEGYFKLPPLVSMVNNQCIITALEKVNSGVYYGMSANSNKEKISELCLDDRAPLLELNGDTANLQLQDLCLWPGDSPAEEVAPHEVVPNHQAVEIAEYLNTIDKALPLDDVQELTEDSLDLYFIRQYLKFFIATLPMLSVGLQQELNEIYKAVSNPKTGAGRRFRYWAPLMLGVANVGLGFWICFGLPNMKSFKVEGYKEAVSLDPALAPTKPVHEGVLQIAGVMSLLVGEAFFTGLGFLVSRSLLSKKPLVKILSKLEGLVGNYQLQRADHFFLEVFFRTKLRHLSDEAGGPKERFSKLINCLHEAHYRIARSNQDGWLWSSIAPPSSLQNFARWANRLDPIQIPNQAIIAGNDMKRLHDQERFIYFGRALSLLGAGVGGGVLLWLMCQSFFDASDVSVEDTNRLQTSTIVRDGKFMPELPLMAFLILGEFNLWLLIPYAVELFYYFFGSPRLQGPANLLPDFQGVFVQPVEGEGAPVVGPFRGAHERPRQDLGEREPLLDKSD